MRKKKKKGVKRSDLDVDVEAQTQTQTQAETEMSQATANSHANGDGAAGGVESASGQHVLQPGLLQVVTWQMPVMFLTSATICMIVGLFLHIWSATPHVGRMGSWDDDSKVCWHTEAEAEEKVL